jgi:hypothetical protein
MSITVGARKPRVNCQFVDITAEQISPIAFQIIISFVVFPKIRFSQGRLFFCCVFTVYAVKKLNTPFLSFRASIARHGIQEIIVSSIGCRIKSGMTDGLILNPSTHAMGLFSFNID